MLMSLVMVAAETPGAEGKSVLLVMSLLCGAIIAFAFGLLGRGIDRDR